MEMEGGDAPAHDGHQDGQQAGKRHAPEDIRRGCKLPPVLQSSASRRSATTTRDGDMAAFAL